MSKLLYIKASPKQNKNSNSLTVAKAFIDEYKSINKEAEIITIDLYKDKPMLIDEEIINAWEKIGQGFDFEKLEKTAKEKLNKLNDMIEIFKSADDYLIASGLWALNINTLLKAYFDCIVSDGKTFKHDEHGNIVGLLKNKKAVYIQSSGGIYDRSNVFNVDYASRYMKTIFAFMGVNDFTLVNLDGMDISITKKEIVRGNSIREVKKIAKRFNGIL